MSALAVNGGTPVIDSALPEYRSIGEPELEAVTAVVRSGVLSGFYGSWGDAFHGGPTVKRLEQRWRDTFGVKHAVSVNSATSGLFAAMGAVGIQPGDEVIVPPYTMSATAMAPLVYGGIPVFVDVDPETFCLDVAGVRAALTPKTKAILAVNLFGHPAPLAELRRLADERGLKLVEDNAQGPFAKEGDRFAGSIGHIGVFSLNYHKHIHAGEGGMCVTDDAELALRLELIRNHGENAAEPLKLTNLVNLVGFNYRLTELSAAVAIAQLDHADRHLEARVRVAQRLSEAVAGLEGFTAPAVRRGCRHMYYVWALKLDEAVLGVPRAELSRALTAEGFPHGVGYVRPLYKLPLFQKRVAFGAYPFNLSKRRYDDVVCPVVERMHTSELLTFENCKYAIDDGLTNKLAEALRKVHSLRHTLKGAR